MSRVYITWNKGEKIVFSPHFTSTEFTCPCGKCKEQNKIAVDLIDKLERVRVKLGIAIRITSGYRCPNYQAELKARGYETAVGVSQHELGNAVDLQPMSLTTLGFPTKMVELEKLLKEEFKALGRGKSFFHVDLRDDKERFWTYTVR